MQSAVSNLKLQGLSLLPSSIKLIDIQDRILDISNYTNFSISPIEVLKSAIHDYLNEYDYVLIDCPPNLGYITQNGIEISDYYLIPTVPDRLSTYGIPQIIKKINELSTWRHLKIKCLGLIITKYVLNSSVHTLMIKDLPARMKMIGQSLNLDSPRIFKTVMPQANATAEAMDYDKKFSTFSEKHGYSRSADMPLHHYVTNLTQEFLRYAGN
ncbi:MAG: AAA family ATPase [Blastocatellia bacterium]|nr:AAA family ATPase [Blastocatellia bacterium]